MTPEEQDAADAAKQKELDAATAQQNKISKKVEAKRAAELAKANDNTLPPEFQQPSVGRIVHFFPNENDKQALENGVEFVAGIVVRTFGNHRADIRIFPAVEEKERYTMRWNVPHQTKAAQVATENSGYWAWPPRS